jgi:addiction module RelE/StbE family toxin
VTIRWTAQAQRDFREQLAFIRQDKPSAAERMADRIQQTVFLLERWPHLGMSLAGGRKQLAIPRTPYLVVYRFTGAEELLILRLLHGAQRR